LPNGGIGGLWVSRRRQREVRRRMRNVWRVVFKGGFPDAEVLIKRA
jgi:uncharacterized protein HemY